MKIKFDFLPRIHLCMVCRRPILGLAYIDAYGNRVCQSHKDSIKYCVSCGRFCTPDNTSIGNDKKICPACENNRPTENERNSIISYIRTRYQESGIGAIPQFTLYLLEPEELRKMGSHSASGYAEMKDNKYNIYVLKYLSKTAFGNVMAHEMLHLWQFQHHIKAPQDISEGFCNMGSYFILQGIKSEVASVLIRGLEQSQDPIYGLGFRKIKAVYDQGGWPAVLPRMKRYRC